MTKYPPCPKCGTTMTPREDKYDCPRCKAWFYQLSFVSRGYPRGGKEIA